MMYVFLHIIEFYLLIFCFKICIYTHKGYAFAVFSVCVCVCVCVCVHARAHYLWAILASKVKLRTISSSFYFLEEIARCCCGC